jgi:formyltetrahydrofolate deformylase
MNLAGKTGFPRIAAMCFWLLPALPSSFAVERRDQGSPPESGAYEVNRYILTVSCRSTRGIVAALSGYLAEKGCNLVDSSQFDSLDTGRFFMRVSIESQEGLSREELLDGITPLVERFGLDIALHDSSRRMKVMLMVSRFGHCLNDLLYRWRIGGLPIDIVGVISNHLDYQKLVVNHDIPFHYIKVGKDNKPQAEAQLLDLVTQTGTELIVLARYMQVLSEELCRSMPGRIINIHHSFLPSFKGANPYKQAYERGVKLIGATAHYVTDDLDEGPIIEQDTVRVTHAQSPDDYVSLGRDVEAQVLARAIHAHIHHRTFIDSNRTVVFPASPGSYASERMG